MVGMFSGIVFVSQVICCICFKDKFQRYLPTIIALVMIITTVLRANLGQMDPQRMGDQTGGCLGGIATILVYLCVMAVWGILMRRRDPAQKLRK